MQITGGKVSFKRSYQPEAYGSKGAEAELTFTLTEGEALEDKMVSTGAAVMQQVSDMLQAPRPAARTAPAAPTHAQLDQMIHDQHGPAAPSPEKPAPVTKPTTQRKMPDKKKPVATPSTDALGDVPQIRSNPENRVELDANGAPPGDKQLDDAPITDKDLGDMCNRAAGRLLTTHGAEASKKVRELIQKYAPRVAEIAADKRKAFKAELEALK